MGIMTRGWVAAAVGLAVSAQGAWATCASRCELACLWADYLAYAREAADDYARAAHYDGGAADGYQQALDAAQGELESMIPSVQGIIEEGILGEACSKAKAHLERVNRAFNALTGIQGAGVLGAMAKAARRSGDYNWSKAQKALKRYRECCKLRPPPPAVPDTAPPPPEPPPPLSPPVITYPSGGGGEPPLGHGVLTDIERARRDFEAGRGEGDLSGGSHPRVLFWNMMRVAARLEADALGRAFAPLARHHDETIRAAVQHALSGDGDGRDAGDGGGHPPRAAAAHASSAGGAAGGRPVDFSRVKAFDLATAQAAAAQMDAHMKGCRDMLEQFKADGEGALRASDRPFISRCTDILLSQGRGLQGRVAVMLKSATTPTEIMAWRQVNRTVEKVEESRSAVTTELKAK